MTEAEDSIFLWQLHYVPPKIGESFTHRHNVINCLRFSALSSDKCLDSCWNHNAYVFHILFNSLFRSPVPQYHILPVVEDAVKQTNKQTNKPRRRYDSSDLPEIPFCTIVQFTCKKKKNWDMEFVCQNSNQMLVILLRCISLCFRVPQTNAIHRLTQRFSVILHRATCFISHQP